MKAPCYQHDSYHRECSSCVEMNQTKPLPQRRPVRSEVEEAREWLKQRMDTFSRLDNLDWMTSEQDVVDAITAYAAHIRTQERERVQKILDGYEVGIMKPFVQQIAAAIREKNK